MKIEAFFLVLDWQLQTHAYQFDQSMPGVLKKHSFALPKMSKELWDC